jgi:hypothetical protein
MLIVVTCHISEAFATSSFRLPLRGGATRHNVISTLERNGMYLDSNNRNGNDSSNYNGAGDGADDDDNDKNDNDVTAPVLLLRNKKIISAAATTTTTTRTIIKPANELKVNGVQQSTSSSSSAVTFIADTALPSDLGLNLRLRAYRTNVPSENGYIGNEPCVIYAADKPPFGDNV